ncbi:hypothetical protein, partial [Aeromonas veronii]|uniref:hypothetical protein n=1 Tax=Aeromonas veronii TaxID=654 RepID=UPI002B4707C9
KPFLYLFQLVGAKDPVHEHRHCELIYITDDHEPDFLVALSVLIVGTGRRAPSIERVRSELSLRICGMGPATRPE